MMVNSGSQWHQSMAGWCIQTGQLTMAQRWRALMARISPHLQLQQQMVNNGWQWLTRANSTITNWSMIVSDHQRIVIHLATQQPWTTTSCNMWPTMANACERWEPAPSNHATVAAGSGKSWQQHWGEQVTGPRDWHPENSWWVKLWRFHRFF